MEQEQFVCILEKNESNDSHAIQQLSTGNQLVNEDDSDRNSDNSNSTDTTLTHEINHLNNSNMNNCSAKNSKL